MNEKAIDLDLDALNYSNDIEHSEEDSVVYVRSGGSDGFMCYSGDLTRIANSLVRSMESDYFLYETIATAVNIFEEENTEKE